MKNFAVIAAAGSGERLHHSLSKMLMPISGKPLLSYTLAKFEESERINEIVLVVRAQDIYEIEQEVLKKNNYKKIKSVVIGGLTRQDSVYNGLMAIKEEDGVVCIHDGARPLIQQWMIEKTIEMISDYDGVILAIPTVDTIKQVKLEEMVVERTVDRSKFWMVQTPQVFRLKKIREYHERARQEKIHSTDDSAIIEYYGGKVVILHGSEENIKVTSITDLLLTEILLNRSHCGR